MPNNNHAVNEAARNIIGDVVAVQTAISGCLIPVVVRQSLNSIQVQARSLLAGGDTTPPCLGSIGHGYRIDMLEMLQGLADHLCCGLGQSKEHLSDEQLHTIALAAEAAHSRINNYLLVKRAENLIERREASHVAQPAA